MLGVASAQTHECTCYKNGMQVKCQYICTHQPKGAQKQTLAQRLSRSLLLWFILEFYEQLSLPLCSTARQGHIDMYKLITLAITAQMGHAQAFHA